MALVFVNVNAEVFAVLTSNVPEPLPGPVNKKAASASVPLVIVRLLLMVVAFPRLTTTPRVGLITRL